MMIKKLLNIAFCLCLLASTEVKAQDTCHVALMVPLYLEQVDEAFCDAEPANRTLNTKPFSFLHFYEGFMIAADSVANSRNMLLDLKVYDVDNDVKKADTAIIDPWLANADLIVGPFYLKPFERVKNFAVENDIPIINPITPRSYVVDNHPNVVKIKPSVEAQLLLLEGMLRKHYNSNNVFIIYNDTESDSLMANKIHDVVERNVEWYRYDADSALVHNVIMQIKCQSDSLELTPIKENLSETEENLFIVYGEDRVFANEIVFKLTKLIQNHNITVIMMPDWRKFDDLFLDNLMKIHAIYFDDQFIDYQNIRVESFICKFRKNYGTEPSDMAFMGFDVGWYFLNGFYVFGENLLERIPYYNIPLLHSQFRFEQKDYESGYENTFWNVYQFKNYKKVILNTDYE